MTDQPALTWTNVVLTVLNIFGIWRWLGRQARGRGGRHVGAPKRARRSPGETLFPVSLLARAPVRSGEAGAWPLRRRHGRLLERQAELRRRLAGRSRRRRRDPAPLALERARMSTDESWLRRVDPSASSGSTSCRGTNGRRADRHRRVRRRRISAGSKGFAARIIPPERNQLPRAPDDVSCPAAVGGERGRAPALARAARSAAPKASIAGLMDLGGGVAFRVVSPGSTDPRRIGRRHFTAC